MSEPKGTSKFRSYAIYGGLGMSMVTEVAVSGLIGYVGGNWLDQKWNCSPWMAVTGVVLLLAASFTHIFRTLMVLQKRLDKEE